MKVLSALFAAGALLAAGPVLACYTVYDAQDRIVYQAQEAPVDMSRPLHETMARAFPGGHLVFGDSQDCQLQSPSRTFLLATSSGTPPLITDERTARTMGLPYTLVAKGIALIPDRPDSMRPGVVLAESGRPLSGPDTRMMGAGSARPSANPTGIGSARPAQRSNNVITEMHDPPLTAVQPSRRR